MWLDYQRDATFCQKIHCQAGPIRHPAEAGNVAKRFQVQVILPVAPPQVVARVGNLPDARQPKLNANMIGTRAATEDLCMPEQHGTGCGSEKAVKELLSRNSSFNPAALLQQIKRNVRFVEIRFCLVFPASVRGRAALGEYRAFHIAPGSLAA